MYCAASQGVFRDSGVMALELMGNLRFLGNLLSSQPPALALPGQKNEDLKG